jgi:HAD superfamily hydrolase (TIGR01459 family)
VAGRLGAPFRPGARVLVVGKQGDDYELDAAGLHAVNAGEPCDFVLFAGSGVPSVSIEAYRRQLAAAAKAALPGLCCNPDLTMLTPTGPQPGCGALAQLYRELGGEVLSVGKPEISFFEEARALFEPILPRRTLVIGDSLDHDILGGRRSGFATVLVRTGVHQQLEHSQLEARIKQTGAAPDFILRSLM